MKTLTALFVFLCAAVLYAAPATYQVPANGALAVNVDADLGEWSDAYFIDSLQSDDNIFCRDNTFPWTRADFQYMVYAAHDASKVYFGLKIIADEGIQSGTNDGCDDAFKINPGGQSAAFYLYIETTVTTSTSCPYALGSTLFAAVNPTGNGTFATAEFSLDKSIVDPFGMGEFRLSVGMEEGDTDPNDCMDTHYGGIGVEYTGNKQDWNSNPWDNPLYYPSWTLASNSIEAAPAAEGSAETLSVSPNPFMPATALFYHVKRDGRLSIYDMAGKIIRCFEIKRGTGRVDWNARGLASGIYLARLKSGRTVLNTRLFLAR